MNTQYFNAIKRRQINGPSAAVVKFNEQEDRAPRVVAQGRGHVAMKIIEMAREHNIHLQEDPDLVENLLDIDLGDSIPPQLYAVMAEILILIKEIDDQY